MPLVGGLAGPHGGPNEVPRRAQTFAVHEAEAEFCGCVPLVGGLAAPHEGLRVVLRRAVAIGAHPSEVGLRVGLALFGQGTQEPHRRRVVAAPIRGSAVFERSRRRNAKQGERENAADEERSVRVNSPRASQTTNAATTDARRREPSIAATTESATPA